MNKLLYLLVALYFIFPNNLSAQYENVERLISYDGDITINKDGLVEKRRFADEKEANDYIEKLKKGEFD